MRRNRRTGPLKSWALAAGMLLAATGCAGGSAAGSSFGSSGSGSSLGIEGPDWERPIRGGIEVTSAADAPLAFQAILPDGLGPPSRILVTPAGVPLVRAAVVWVYDHHPRFGRLLVEERLEDGAAAEAEFGRLAAQPSPGCYPASPVKGLGGDGPGITCYGGLFRWRTLPGGQRAFIHLSDVTTTAHVLLTARVKSDALEAVTSVFEDPVLELVVMGPGSELTEEQVLEAVGLILGSP
jgi:hypothetical protein